MMRTTREFKTITIIPLDDDSFAGEAGVETGKPPANAPIGLHQPGNDLRGNSDCLDKSHVLILAQPESGDFSGAMAHSRPNGNGRHRRNGWIYYEEKELGNRE